MLINFKMRQCDSLHPPHSPSLPASRACWVVLAFSWLTGTAPGSLQRRALFLTVQGSRPVWAQSGGSRAEPPWPCETEGEMAAAVSSYREVAPRWHCWRATWTFRQLISATFPGNEVWRRNKMTDALSREQKKPQEATVASHLAVLFVTALNSHLNLWLFETHDREWRCQRGFQEKMGGRKGKGVAGHDPKDCVTCKIDIICCLWGASNDLLSQWHTLHLHFTPS